VRIVDAADPAPVSRSRFSDMDASLWWAAHVERLADLGVTRGCVSDPPSYCPDQTVKRSEMASFLVRAFDLPGAAEAGFADTGGSVHAVDIHALYASGVTQGCSRDPLRFCPGDAASRAEMASLLHRALNLGTASEGLSQ